MKEAGCSRNSPSSFQCYRVLIICGNGFLPLYANNKNVTNNLRIAYVQSYTIIKSTKLISQAFRRSRLLILMFLIRKCYDNVERFLQIAGFPFWEPSVKIRRKRKKIHEHVSNRFLHITYLYTKIYGSNIHSANGSKRVVFRTILQRLLMQTFLCNHLFRKFQYLNSDGCNE